jgi:hypothetical protein
MARERLMGWLIVALGLIGALAIQVASPPAQPPLYDGVVVVEPYLWLDPPPDHPGGATGSSTEIAVAAGRNDLFAAATYETPPQAQIFGIAGSLIVASGATKVSLAIQPVPNPAAPADGYVDGNVYRFDVRDQLGRTVTARPEAVVTIILRPADPGVRGAKIGHFDGVAWHALATLDAGQAGVEAVVTDFGDFAILAEGVSPYPTASAAPTTPVAPSLVPEASQASPSTPVPIPVDQMPPGSGPLPIVVAIIVAWTRRRYTGPPGWGPR